MAGILGTAVRRVETAVAAACPGKAGATLETAVHTVATLETAD